MTLNQQTKYESLLTTDAALRKAAKLSINMLQIDCNYSLAILLGFPAELTNIQVLEKWLAAYISKNPDKCSFKKHVFPALRNALQEYEQLNS